MHTQIINGRWTINGRKVQDCSDNIKMYFGKIVRQESNKIPSPTPPIGLNKTHNYKFKNQ